jgi:hypothetical protein
MNNSSKKNISDVLTTLPKRILKNKDNNYLADFILYEIAKEECLELETYAYFIYNPDFHICKGISGIKHEDVQTLNSNLWDAQDLFINHIKENTYNKNIKSIEFCTISKKSDIQAIVEEIKKILEIDTLNIFTWDLPNNNIGILLFTKNNCSTEDIEKAASLLGFCSIPV